MAPGITGGGEGRPHPTPVIKFYSCLIDRNLVPVTVNVGNFYKQTKGPYLPITSGITERKESSSKETKPERYFGKTVKVPLIRLCYGRSGDKGDVANIGLLARKPEYYQFLKRTVTSEVVHEYMKHLVKGKVMRYELPGILGFNFVLTKSLGGGGVSSLRIDRQGKAYAQMLLSLKVKVPAEWIPEPESKL